MLELKLAANNMFEVEQFDFGTVVHIFEDRPDDRFEWTVTVVNYYSIPIKRSRHRYLHQMINESILMCVPEEWAPFYSDSSKWDSNSKQVVLGNYKQKT